MRWPGPGANIAVAIGVGSNGDTFYTALVHKSSGVSRWLVAGVSALLLGILGMYALGLHGVSPGPSHAQTSTERAYPGPAGHSERAAVPATVPSQSQPGDGKSHQGMHGMAGLCLAILAAGLLCLGAIARNRSPHRWMTLRSRVNPRVLCPAPCWYASSGPPYVWAFSVIRC